MPEDNSLQWNDCVARDVGEVVVAAMAAGGVDHLFFTSGSDIVFYQEAIAKLRLERGLSMRLVSVPHEHVALNAALGYAAVSGRPTATAVHVDVGTQHYGAAVHTAHRAGLPVLVTAGAPPTAPTGTMRGGRDEGAHLWLQQTFDQNSIVRQYMKWDHRLEFQDNPGVTVSRALQVALSEPRGPVYLSIPREIAFRSIERTAFPSAAQLGIPRPPAPDPDGIRELARRLVAARNPCLIVARSGRDPATVGPLVALCELLGMAVVDAASRAYLSFPMDHPLYLVDAPLGEADVVVALDAVVPWIPGARQPGPETYVCVIGVDPIALGIPTYEFTAHMRLAASPLLAIEALRIAVGALLSEADRSRIGERASRLAKASSEQRQSADNKARAAATTAPIEPRWLSHEISRSLDDNCILLDETTPGAALRPLLRCSRPGSYISNPGSSGGWSPGAAFGAKLAAPDRDVIAVTGDGFYMFGSAGVALWAAARHGAPIMIVVYQNRSYSTGTVRLAQTYPDGYAVRSQCEGGYFDPPIDFAKEAEAAGAYGENVRDPAQISSALTRGREHMRRGRPAVIAVWLPRLLCSE
jgi:acetolactate synthase I/II/III large subunit